MKQSNAFVQGLVVSIGLLHAVSYKFEEILNTVDTPKIIQWFADNLIDITIPPTFKKGTTCYVGTYAANKIMRDRSKT